MSLVVALGEQLPEKKPRVLEQTLSPKSEDPSFTCRTTDRSFRTQGFFLEFPDTQKVTY